MGRGVFWLRTFLSCFLFGFLSTHALAHSRAVDRDAVIIVGCTPPASQYFAFTPYVTMHYTAATNTWTNIFGSMGDSVNQASVQTFGNDGSVGSSPWGYACIEVDLV